MRNARWTMGRFGMGAAESDGTVRLMKPLGDTRNIVILLVLTITDY
ncbi:MAG TPA: hypothetical protein VE641_01140 [Chthoniobacterales bacterium]|nr:hypothetical protein [Chthoniobacterales bacterium]